MKKFMYLFFGVAAAFMLTSCLTVERKDYTFKFTSKEGGELSIVFYNIMSASEEGKDMTQKDFDDLIKNYYKGSKIQDEYPTCRILKKEIYEEKGILCGKIILGFTKLSDVNLYQHQGKGPVMMYLKNVYEIYDKSNGEYGGILMPVIFWKKGKKLTLTTTIQQPAKKTSPLLDKFKEWQQINEPYKVK